MNNLAIALLLFIGFLIMSKRKDNNNWIKNFQVTESLYPIIYRIRIQAIRYNIPSWILLRIALIESAFNPNAIGQTGDYGLFQITQPVIDDYNSAKGTNWTGQDLIGNETLSADIAAWLLRKLLSRFNNDIEKAVKAYHTGIGGINSDAAKRYWQRFQAAGTIFAEE